MYQIIIKPITAKIKPPLLNCVSFINSIFFNILFIFDGNMAYKIPSIKRKRPNAINSLIKIGYSDLGFIFPKNLKNSLSGDNINDVSPPIRAVSYACIAL